MKGKCPPEVKVHNVLNKFNSRYNCSNKLQEQVKVPAKVSIDIEITEIMSFLIKKLGKRRLYYSFYFCFNPKVHYKETIISRLSWVSLFLGFQTLGLYVHNDVMLTFGIPEKQILIKLIFAQLFQSDHGKTSYGFDVFLSSTSGPTFNVGQSIWLPVG